ncbi:MAG: hypothetical protein ABIQ60_04290, partial [Burkholderiaceae bacterium]
MDVAHRASESGVDLEAMRALEGRIEEPVALVAIDVRDPRRQAVGDQAQAVLAVGQGRFERLVAIRLAVHRIHDRDRSARPLVAGRQRPAASSEAQAGQQVIDLTLIGHDIAPAH